MNLLHITDTTLVEKTDLSRKLTLAGITKAYPVYRVRLDQVFYNDQNDRIATWMSKYRSDNHIDNIDKSDIASYNRIIEEFIVDSNPDAMKRTKNNIRAIGQQEFGVVLNDGRIIDGNRRFTCLRQIERETGQPQFFKAVILSHDIEHNAKQIKMLELALQLGVDKPVDYDPVDRLVGLYQVVEETKLLTVEEYAANTSVDADLSKAVKKLKNDLVQAKLMIEYLEFLNAKKQYHLVKELNLYYPIEELSKILKDFDENDDRKEDVKNIVFANFTVLPEGDMTRYIRKIKKIINNKRFVNEFIDDQMELAENVVEIIDENETVDESVISTQLRNNQLSNDFSQSTEKWLAKAESDASKNQPALLLEKAYNTIDSIDTYIFLKMSGEELELVSDRIERIIKKLDDLKGELDV